MKRAIYTGTFNPIHNTHIEVMRNASVSHEMVEIFVYDDNKDYSVDLETRFSWVEKAVKETKLNNVKVSMGTVEEFETKIRNNNIYSVIRRLKKTTDISREELMSKQYLHNLKEDIDVHYIVTSSKLSSAAIRRLIRSGKDPIVEVKLNDEVVKVDLLPKSIKEEVVGAYSGQR